MKKSVRLKAALHQKNDSWFLELKSGKKSNKAFCEFLNDMAGEHAEVLVLETNDSTQTYQTMRINFRVKSGPDLEKIKSGLKDLFAWAIEK